MSPGSPGSPAATGLDHNSALAWYEQWLRAWNEQRPEMCYDLLTEDFVLSTPTLRNAAGPVVGPAAAADYMRYVLGMYPDLVWERTGPVMLSPDGTRAAYSWRGTGHFTGRMDPPGIEGNGRAFEFTGVEVFDFRGDGSREHRAGHLDVSYDLLGLLTQVGVLGRDRARR